MMRGSGPSKGDTTHIREPRRMASRRVLSCKHGSSPLFSADHPPGVGKIRSPPHRHTRLKPTVGKQLTHSGIVRKYQKKSGTVREYQE